MAALDRLDTAVWALDQGGDRDVLERACDLLRETGDLMDDHLTALAARR